MLGNNAHQSAALAALDRSPTTWIHGLLDLVGAEPKQGRIRQCPAHKDSTPSLSIGIGSEGQTLVYCFAGCRTDDVLEALHISFAHFRKAPHYGPDRHVKTWMLKIAFPPVCLHTGGSPAGRGMRLVGLHDYGQGEHRLERWRHPKTGTKELLWATRKNGVLMPGLFGKPVSAMPLYLERDIRMAVAADEQIVVVESESSVDALVKAGITATTWAGGAGSPNLPRLRAVLAGADVLLVPDNDAPGVECAEKIHRALTGVAAHLAVVLPPEGQDARDLLETQGPGVFDVR